MPGRRPQRGTNPKKLNLPDVSGKLAEDLGVQSIFGLQQVDKPSPLFPKHVLNRFSWNEDPLFEFDEKALIQDSQEMVRLISTSPYNLDSIVLVSEEEKRNVEKGFDFASVQREKQTITHRALSKYIEDILATDVFPMDLLRPMLKQSASGKGNASNSLMPSHTSYRKRPRNLSMSNDSDIVNIAKAEEGLYNELREDEEEDEIQKDLLEEEQDDDDDDENDYMDGGGFDDDDEGLEDDDGGREADF
jgi:hypothetical protein